MQYFADRSHVLLVERRLWPLHSATDDAQFARQLVDTLEMPGQSFVRVIDARTRELKKTRTPIEQCGNLSGCRSWQSAGFD